MSIQFKRSSTAGLAPAVSDVKQGELVINLPDKKIYTLDNNNSVINIGFSKSEADSTFVPFTGGTLTGMLKGYSTTATMPTELTPKQYVDSLVNSTSNTVTSNIASWKTWLPIAGGTMTGRLLLNGLTPTYDNEAVSKSYVQSNYYSSYGGQLNGSVELYSSQPYIDFHYNNSTADYTSRIIAADSTTLQILSGNITLVGNVGVSGGLSSTGNIASSGTISASSNITSASTVQGSTILGTTIHSTGALQIDGSGVFNANLNVGSKTVSQGFGANIGRNDDGTTGYGFNTELNTGYFMYKAAITNKSFLSLRNHGVDGISVASDYVNLNLNTYYKGTLLETFVSNLASSSTSTIKSGIVAMSPYEIYSGTPTGQFTVYFSSAYQTMYALLGKAPTYVAVNIRAWKAGQYDIHYYRINIGSGDDWTQMVLGTSGDDTDQGRVTSIAAASTFIVPYESWKYFYCYYLDGAGSNDYVPDVKMSIVGCQ